MLCTDIIVDIIDELRRDRKIKMAIKDSNYLKEYIAVDLDEADQTDVEQQSAAVKKIVNDKLVFKKGLAKKLSIIKLNFIYRVVEELNPGRAGILDPGRFAEKAKKLDDRDQLIKEHGIDISLQGLGIQQLNIKKSPEKTKDVDSEEEDQGDAAMIQTKDPMIVHIETVFGKIKKDIEKVGAI